MASSQFDSYNNNIIDDGKRISPSFLSQEIPLRNLGALIPLLLLGMIVVLLLAENPLGHDQTNH